MPTIENITENNRDAERASLRTPESYLDEVAIEHGYESYADAEIESVVNLDDTSASILREAIHRILEDAFKAQKEICAEHAEIETIGEYHEGYEMDVYEVVVKKSSILEAPTPKTINENKN